MEISRRVEQRVGAQKVLLADLEEKRGLLEGAKQTRETHEQAQVVLQDVAKTTQEVLQFRVSELVTTALQLFPEPYEFALIFEAKRGQSEARCVLLSPEGEELDPLTAVGGGVVDMAAFALRLALWCLRRPRTRNTLILDEPFRFLSRGLQPAASDLIKSLSTKLGVQFIIVSHEETLMENADQFIRVRKQNGKSVVEIESTSLTIRKRRTT